MNREYKFRIWDNGTKSMHEVFSFCKDYVKVLVNDNVYKWNRQNFEPIMQYTGLKDRNGKEIYEADILHAINYNLFFVVEFRLGEFVCQKGIHVFGRSLWNQAEIVGNLYANPELLSFQPNTP